MNIQVDGHFLLQAVQETNEFPATMPRLAGANDFKILKAANRVVVPCRL
jgi:hypothetical protein